PAPPSSDARKRWGRLFRSPDGGGGIDAYHLGHRAGALECAPVGRRAGGRRTLHLALPFAQKALAVFERVHDRPLARTRALVERLKEKARQQASNEGTDG